MKPIRRHLNYANIVATLALLFAMSGGALAASHYLITSTKQISPKVLKRLRGRVGVTGRTGPVGAQGPAGAKGDTGSQGPQGAEGPKGLEGPKGVDGVEGASALSPLAPGVSESGVYGLGAGPSHGEHIVLAITFPKELTETIPVSHVFYTPASVPVAHCSGPGDAEPGYLCIYSGVALGISIPELIDPETDSNLSTGKLGFALTWKTKSVKALGEEEVDVGSYTVTAPG